MDLHSILQVDVFSPAYPNQPEIIECNLTEAEKLEALGASVVDTAEYGPLGGTLASFNVAKP